jgi:hypothetical protein
MYLLKETKILITVICYNTFFVGVAKRVEGNWRKLQTNTMQNMTYPRNSIRVSRAEKIRWGDTPAVCAREEKCIPRILKERDYKEGLGINGKRKNIFQ